MTRIDYKEKQKRLKAKRKKRVEQALIVNNQRNVRKMNDNEKINNPKAYCFFQSYGNCYCLL